MAWLLAGLALAGSAAIARETLGGYRYWAAFRDKTEKRCEAMSRPVARTRGATLDPFIAVASWPARGVRGQLHVRLSRPRRADAPVRLAIGPRWALLVANGPDAWARDDATDPVIVAVMRAGAVLRIESIAENGRRFADVYRLDGAASAIDAAALGCLTVR